MTRYLFVLPVFKALHASCATLLALLSLGCGLIHPDESEDVDDREPMGECATGDLRLSQTPYGETEPLATTLSQTGKIVWAANGTCRTESRSALEVVVQHESWRVLFGRNPQS